MSWQHSIKIDDQCNWLCNTRSSPADVKQNKHSREYHREIENISNYLPLGNDADFGTIQTLQMFL